MSRAKRIVDAITKPFRRAKPAPVGGPPKRIDGPGSEIDVRATILHTMREHLAFERKHPVPYADDQRLKALVQRVTAHGVVVTPEIEREIVAVMRDHRPLPPRS